MGAGVRRYLLPQVPAVVSELGLAEEDFPHLAGFVLDQRRTRRLKAAGDAPPAKGLESAGGAGDDFLLLIVAPDRLVQLLAGVQSVQALVEDPRVVLGEPHDVAAVVD